MFLVLIFIIASHYIIVETVYVGVGTILTISFAKSDMVDCPSGNSFVYNLALFDSYTNGSFSVSPTMDLVFQSFYDCSFSLVDQENSVNNQLNCNLFQDPIYLSQTFQTSQPEITAISIMLSIASPLTTGQLLVKLESPGPTLIANWSVDSSSLSMLPQLVLLPISSVPSCTLSPSPSPTLTPSQSSSLTTSVSVQNSQSTSTTLSVSVSPSLSSMLSKSNSATYVYPSFSQSPTYHQSFSSSSITSSITVTQTPSVNRRGNDPSIGLTSKVNQSILMSTTTTIKTSSTTNKDDRSHSIRRRTTRPRFTRTHTQTPTHTQINESNDENDTKSVNKLEEKKLGIGLSIGSSAGGGLVFASTVAFFVIFYRRNKNKDLRQPDLHPVDERMHPLKNNGSILNNMMYENESILFNNNV